MKKLASLLTINGLVPTYGYNSSNSSRTDKIHSQTEYLKDNKKQRKFNRSSLC